MGCTTHRMGAGNEATREAERVPATVYKAHIVQTPEHAYLMCSCADDVSDSYRLACWLQRHARSVGDADAIKYYEDIQDYCVDATVNGLAARGFLDG
jgi:hypothetical protein